MNSTNLGIGMNVGVNYRADLGSDYYANIGFSFSGMGGSFGTENRIGYGVEVGNEDFGLGLYTTKYNSSNGTSQRVGGIGFYSGPFSARYENDGVPFSGTLGDGSDQYRTAAVQLGWGDVNVRMNLMTGKFNPDCFDKSTKSKMYPNGYHTGGGVNDIRLGALTLGYGNYRFGANSEWVRHAFQDRFAHGIVPQPGYLMLDKNILPYFNYTSNTPYSLW